MTTKLYYLFLCSVYVLLQLSISNTSMKLDDNIVINNKIDEEKYVSIGGIEQWITIKGDDMSKPVILFLHGGPGSTMSPYENSIYSKWEKDFVLVQWDQRGAGRTFGHNRPEKVDENYWIENPLTVEKMTADGIELAEYLTKHLHKQKIIIIGTSWGSILGIKMALKSPELFHAYIGHSQLVNPSVDIVNAYKMVYKMAQKANDQESIEKLTLLGAPPYNSAKNMGQLFRIIKKYERKNSTPAPLAWWKLSSSYNNEIDIKNRYAGDDYSFIHFVGHEKLGIKAMINTVNFMKDELKFKIPVYFIHGNADITTTAEVVKKYFDKIQAPNKVFFLLMDAGHGHNQSVVDKQYEIVKDKIQIN